MPPSPGDESHIRALTEALNTAARRAYRDARRKIRPNGREVPSGIPYPDNTHRITNAGKAQQHAMETYLEALKSFNDYVAGKGEGAAPLECRLRHPPQRRWIIGPRSELEGHVHVSHALVHAYRW